MLFRSRSFRRSTSSRLHASSSRFIAFTGLLRLGGVCALLLASALVLVAGGAPTRPQVLNNYGKLPLSFETNRGQTDGQVKFISRGAGYTLFLTPTEAVFSLQQNRAEHGVPSSESAINNGAPELAEAVLNHAPKPARQNNSILRVQLVNADRNAAVTGLNELPGRTNYFRGNDPSKWTTDVETFAKVQYRDVLKGIDLVYYGNQSQLEYDFVVSPGADAQQINLKFNGARNLHVDRRTGDLVLRVGQEEIRFHKPVAYQNEAVDSKHLVVADYVLDSNNHVSFALGSYDHSKPLVIDPTLSYSTYLGGSSNDYATAITVDSTGSAYVTGYTNSVNFPTTSGAFQTACGGGCSGTSVDAFVSKLDPTGSFLIYSTYLGGSGNDYGNGIALDASGDAYIAGQTFSIDFPTTGGAFQNKCGTDSCASGYAFVTELNSTGSALVYSTYLGGNGKNQGNAVVLDAFDNAYVTGYTQSITFPVTAGAFQTTCKCSQTVAFVTKLNSKGSALVYSTYLGGTNGDVGYGIALDSSNNAYLTGYTQSFNFPTTHGAFQTSLGANRAAWITKLNVTGSALVYSTYLGGTTSVTTPCEACGTAIAVDSSGNAYVCGLTAESNFPITPGAYQTTFMGPTNGHDAFLTKLNPTGSGLVFSTYLGGNGDTGSTGIALDQSGNIWLKGNTKSAVFPVTPGAFQTVLGGAFDAFVSELNPAGSQLLYSTYLGGSGTEYGGATAVLALDTQNPPGVYVTGYTDSTNYPVIAGSLQTSNAGENDGFVSKLSPSPNVGLSPGLNFGYQADGTTSAPQTMTLTNTGNTSLTVNNVTITGPNSGDFAQTNTCSTVLPQATCAITVTFTPSISGTETANVSITDNAPGSPQLGALTGNGIGNGPGVMFSPTSLTFATQLIGTSSPSQAVTLTNIGNAALAITSISVSSNFSQTNNCHSSVAAGATCTITVTFKPTKPNVINGSVTVKDNAAGSPQTVSLTGTGTYVLLSPSSLNFGTITVGTSSAPQATTFTNKAKFALTIKSLTITGTNSTDFTETNTCGTSVASGASCTITVTFTPTATGLRTADVSVSDGGGGSPQLVALTGTGQ
jgi:Beta-propeller repeat/Protein of unknown function (DUF1573)/Abnormal spindle-like microcephaly-assoc'd, ASPM-SPD-2-Hydin